MLAIWDGPQAAATAVWLPPGAYPWTARRKLAAAGALTRAMLADPRHFWTFMRSGATLDQDHPVEPHCYLVTLSAHPEHQRQGFGSRLVTPILERADRGQLPCYLETSDPANVDFYERFGFHIVNPALAAIPGGPAHITMRREPAPPAASSHD